MRWCGIWLLLLLLSDSSFFVCLVFFAEERRSFFGKKLFGFAFQIKTTQDTNEIFLLL
jgi:hypothetical protein